MQVKWLVENFDPDNKLWELVDELKRRGQPLELIDYYRYYATNKVLGPDGMPSNSQFADDDCVIFCGSLQAAMWIRRNKPWVPGVWLDPEQFKCTNYYSYLGEFLFNQDYEFSTVGEYKRRVDHFFAKYGIDDCVFVRPDTGLKSFTGQIFKRERHDVDWNHFDQLTRPHEVVVVASPKVMKAEYRIVMAEGRAVTGSMYHYEGKIKQFPGAPKKVMALAEEIAKVADEKLTLGPMYVIDIVETWEGEYKLMEVNCFNCAGLYSCDKAAVVDAVNEVALKEYKEYQNI